MDVNTFLGIVLQLFRLFHGDTNEVTANMNNLEKTMRIVSARKHDLIVQLEQEERRPGKKRKAEVVAWMENAASLEDQVRKVGRKVKEGCLFSHLRLENRVSGLAASVQKLHEMSKFDKGLTLDVIPARGYELRPGELVGQASQTKMDEIWNCLMKEEVLQVGVWGQAGGGKTFLAKHIHDKIVKDSTRFDGACFVNVSRKGTVNTIQTDVANYLRQDFTGVSGVYRGAKLKEALRGRRLLFILDDVCKYYSLEQVGIPLERNGCKLIVTSRSRGVCEQMDCRELVHVTNFG